MDAPLFDKAGGSIPTALDLVVHMGRESRFGGWGAREWTVLHHSYLVSLLWLRAGYPREQLAYAMLHDAHEAYTGDLPSPMKRTLKAFGAGDAVERLEDAIQATIFESVSLPHPEADVLEKVKLVDLAALLIEAPLFGSPGTEGKVIAELERDAPEMAKRALAFIDEVMPEFRLIVSQRKNRVLPMP